jgi:hypothetical protein
MPATSIATGAAEDSADWLGAAPDAASEDGAEVESPPHAAVIATTVTRPTIVPITLFIFIFIFPSFVDLCRYVKLCRIIPR